MSYSFNIFIGSAASGGVLLRPAASFSFQAESILRPVRPIWPMHGSYTGRCGQCVVYTDRQWLP